jgi:hypothetical protein
MAVALALALAGCGGGDSSERSVSAPTTATAASAPSASVTTGTPRASAEATTPATPSVPGARALPVHIPGFTLRPVRIGTARESLVFRTRNSILNGLTGQASDYALEIGEAAGRGDTSLLIGVVARPGTSPPDIPGDVNRLIEVEPEASFRVQGREVALYRVPAYDLAVVDAGPRHAVVAIAVGRPLARAIASAVAGALPG